jgi:hypothetical protein
MSLTGQHDLDTSGPSSGKTLKLYGSLNNGDILGHGAKLEVRRYPDLNISKKNAGFIYLQH